MGAILSDTLDRQTISKFSSPPPILKPVGRYLNKTMPTERKQRRGPREKRHLLATAAALLGIILTAMALVLDPLTAPIAAYTGNPQTVSEISGVAIRLFVFGILLLSVGLTAY